MNNIARFALLVVAIGSLFNAWNIYNLNQRTTKLEDGFMAMGCAVMKLHASTR